MALNTPPNTPPKKGKKVQAPKPHVAQLQKLDNPLNRYSKEVVDYGLANKKPVISNPGRISPYDASGYNQLSPIVEDQRRKELWAQLDRPETTQEKIMRGATDVAPYLSNFINAFRRAPEPAFPKSVKPVTFSKVNFDADRTDIDRSVAGANQGLTALGENQAAALRTGNLIQGIRGKNQLAQAEQNMNAQISNSAAAMNQQVDQINTMNYNAYQDAQVNQDLMNMTQQSANVANAADKFVASQNQKDLMKLEGTKYKILSELYRPAGVLQRFTSDFDTDKRTGTPVYKFDRRLGGNIGYSAGAMRKVFATGGELDPKPKPVMPAPMPATNSYVGQNIYSRTMEADRAGDAMVLSPRTTQFATTQLNIAPRPAQTAEAMRSGDYFAPPPTNFQSVSIKAPIRPAPAYAANLVRKFAMGGKLKKVY